MEQKGYCSQGATVGSMFGSHIAQEENAQISFSGLFTSW